MIEARKTEVSEHRERFDRTKTHYLGWIAFLFGFSDSFLVYILSSYFAEAIGGDNVSAFYFFAFGIIFAALFFLHTGIRMAGGSLLFLLFLLVVVIVQIPLIFLPVSFGGSALIMVYLIVTALAWVVLDVLLERFSKDEYSGRIRGFHLSAINLGFLFAPFLAAFVLGRYGFSGIFFVSLVFYSVLFLVSLFFLFGSNVRFKKRAPLMEAFRNVLHRPDILRIYAVSFALNFFYAAMIVYTSLRLRELGMAWDDIGIVFTVMLLPFVLVQYPLGIVADKRLGEKELLIGSILLSALSTAALAWIGSASVFVWAVALFLTRVGIAGVEVLSDTYFYKRIEGNDGDLIAFFRTARPMGNVAAAILLGVWLLVFPLSNIFLVPAVVLLLALIPVFFLEDNLSECDRELLMQRKLVSEASKHSRNTSF